jgi:riboflavin synthase
MFTGLIHETGRVTGVERKSGASNNITITAKVIPSRLHEGDSVSVSGVCLTALDIHSNRFSADLAQETLQRTSLGTLAKDSIVNLELPANAGDPLGGHVVQGHVDGTARLVSLERIQNHDDWRLTMAIPRELARYVVPQGSITVEGISLTVAAIHADKVEIAVIPHTYRVTNLHTLRPGDRLNIEVDILARYAEKLTQGKQSAGLTVDDLIKRGF